MAAQVALCEEGVDRNGYKVDRLSPDRVALCEEGVDRNLEDETREHKKLEVALCEEGVDRNPCSIPRPLVSKGRPLRRGRG